MNRLWVRLTLAFLAVAWLGIAVIALIVGTTTSRNFRQYVNQRDASFFSQDVIDSLQAYYAQNGTWTGADSLLPSRGSGGGSGHGQGQGGRGQGAGSGGAQVLLADESGVVMASTDSARVGTLLDETLRNQATELVVDGVGVGWLVQVTPGAQALGVAEERFLNDTTQWLVAAAVGGSLLAVVVGLALAWQLTRPMRALTEAAHDLAHGELGRQVDIRGTTEISDMALAFNSMSHDLAQGEALRRRMAADIAHELRTPVSVLRGHLEAMLDGVFPLDAEHLAVAYDRTIHLARLVDDLRLLTRAEARQLPLERVTMQPDVLAAQAVESFAPLALDREIALEHAISGDLPPVWIDVDRVLQVLGNLLANALHHTPTGGTITLRAARAGDCVRFAVANTGSELTPTQIEQVFTPFWRAEDARDRDRGGSGLGLAIAQQVIALHDGRIWVESGGGVTTFMFDLPAARAA